MARLYGPAVAVKGSLRRASPALDRAHRTLSAHPTHSNFKRGKIMNLHPEALADAPAAVAAHHEAHRRRRRKQGNRIMPRKE